MSSRDYILYALVIFGWSTSWLPLKGQIGFVAPEVSILWRFMIAGALCFLLHDLEGLSLDSHFIFICSLLLWDCSFLVPILPYFIMQALIWPQGFWLLCSQRLR